MGEGSRERGRERRGGRGIVLSCFVPAVQFAEFDQLMRGDRDNLNSLLSRVQHWLVCKRWKKVIYGAISVQKREDA